MPSADGGSQGGTAQKNGKRRSGEEVRSRAREPDDERVPAGDDSARVLPLPASTSSAPTMSRMKIGAGRLHDRLEHPVDRVGEGARAHRLAVREAEAAAERERVRLEVRRDRSSSAATSGCRR